MTENIGSSANLRNTERVSTRRPAKILTQDTTYEGVVINLSLEGIGILLDQNLADGTEIKIQFSLPGYEQSSTLSLSGQIVHATEVHQNFLLGVRFALLNPHAKLVITGFINYHHRLD